MGAARFAHLSRLASDPAYRINVQQSWHENQIKTLKDNFAKELAAARDAVRRELTAEIVSVRRELLTAKSEAEQLRVANADSQRKLQEGDAAITSLRAEAADLQRQLKALNNISSFLAGVARGEHNDKS
jgi:chromosome segregation ATPase